MTENNNIDLHKVGTVPLRFPKRNFRLMELQKNVTISAII